MSTRRRSAPSAFGFPVPASPASLDGVVNVHDFEPIARERLDARAYGYFASGAGDERSVADNLAAWRRWRLLPTVLTGARDPDTSVSLLGTAAALPFGIAPTALQGMAHPDGEIAMARAAAAAGVPFVLSTASTRSLEEVAASAGTGGSGPRWFQLYVEPDMGFARELVERAEAAGYGAIVLTVDLPVAGYRERDLRTRFAIPASVQAHVPAGRDASEETFMAYIDRKPELRWADVATVANWTSLPLVVKGILAPRDVERAIDHGARAVWLSNHGGRQLDGAVTAAEMLPEAVEAARGRAELYVDGGVRRGSDLLVALALGARAAFLGRPFLYALAAAGEVGVAHAIAVLAEELRRGLTILGATGVGDLRPSHVRVAT
ncbi:MAG TPA: alpha-hydroxy acid oxidase [Candidatus Limnocylindria bacterium]|nr:alpha-hydroxy acid oxidase [Candidatus Limnocylindria bacterium]